MSDQARSAARPGGANPLIKFAIDFGPLVVFFVVYYVVERYQPESGIYWATGILMGATAIALVASRLLLGHVAAVPLVTAVVVGIFGGLTIWLRDPRFVMIKPTIINLLFAAILGFGLVIRRPLLKLVMGEALKLTDAGWRTLTVRWAFFFIAIAILNEVVWRNFSQPTWVTFKVWGILPLTLIFAVLQVGLIKRHEARADA